MGAVEGTAETLRIIKTVHRIKRDPQFSMVKDWPSIYYGVVKEGPSFQNGVKEGSSIQYGVQGIKRGPHFSMVLKRGPLFSMLRNG